MSEDAPGVLVVLDRVECLELLAGHDVGRVAVVDDDGRPMIFPVNYVLDGDLVVFRADPGTKLTHASLDHVAFEVDEIDPERREAWSVVVSGIGREVTDAIDETSVRERSLPLVSWVGGPKANWVHIAAPVITGRRITHGGRSRTAPGGGD